MAEALQNDHAYVQFKNVKKSYDHKVLVVKDFNLTIKKGEFITLLGPSGSGKSTCLMMLAGFEDVTSGEVLVDGLSITKVAPNKRNIGIVFQHYALFPHMTIAENLAYPLHVRKLSTAQVDEKVKEYLQLVELEAFAERYPQHLSGGQRQRVALARALIFDPSIVLMDEPLGALDKKLREQMQFEIKRLHDKLGFTVIYVTHDQTEALTMSDRIAVFNEGVVQQCAPPDVLYEQPANAFVADFIGESNQLNGELKGIDNGVATVVLADGSSVKAMASQVVASGQPCLLSVRPEKMFLPPQGGNCDNTLTAAFVTKLYVGDSIRYYFETDDGSELMVKALNDESAPEFAAGERTEIVWSHRQCYALDAPNTTT